ncbi:MAG: AmmeMemoRadiSam system protein A [Firmicutes bacterium]|nr:AmmeMemoRadiSam system protein A [Bacillota bacterium]
MSSKTMGEVLLGALAPHPPLLIPEIGLDALAGVENTLQAMMCLAETVKGLEPDVVVVISPHGPLLPDGIGIRAIETLEGDFGQFGASHIALSYDNDLELLEALLEEGKTVDYPLRRVDWPVIRTYGWSPRLDYATLVPLYYLDQVGVHTPILAMGMGFLPPWELYEFGAVLRQAIHRMGRRGVVIASGDLSHRLTKDAPNGYTPQGKVFDETLWHFLEQGNVEGLLDIDIELLEEAGECGYRSLIMLLGCWDKDDLVTIPLSYEGPYGVGYGVCVMHSIGQQVPSCLRSDPDSMPGSSGLGGNPSSTVCKEHATGHVNGHVLVRLARKTVEALAKDEAVPECTRVNLPQDLPVSAGVFVSIKKHGELRGCIGTIGPTKPDLVSEVVYVAGQASTADPRFDPIAPDELKDLSYSVDVLGPPELVDDLDDLDPKRYGVIVEAGRRKGLLLPDLEGIDSVAQQVSIARSKAGIGQNEDVKLFRFSVQRYL